VSRTPFSSIEWVPFPLIEDIGFVLDATAATVNPLVRIL